MISAGSCARRASGAASRCGRLPSSTKIAAAALEALESNDISKLPGGIFSRAFVRSYAVEVGLDPDETVKEFLERFNQEAPPPLTPRPRPIPEDETRVRGAATQGGHDRSASVLIGLAACWRSSSTSRWRARSALATRRRRPRRNAPPHRLPRRRRQPPRSPMPPPVTSRASASADRAATLNLELHPRRPCWVSLTVDGKKLFARIMQAGERESHDVASARRSSRSATPAPSPFR